MKLAVVSHWLSKTGGGISSAVEEASIALMTRGASVEVLGLEDGRWKDDCATWRGAPARVFPIVGPRALGISPRLRFALCTSNADIAHLHGIWMHPSAGMLAWSRGGRPFLVSPHGMLDPWAVKRSAAKKRLVRLLYEDRALRAATCIHALNGAEADAVRAFGLSNPICVIPNGVSLPTPGPKPAAPWACNFNPKARVLLFLGRLHPKKNLHGLLNAIAILKARNELGDWRLAVAGWDQEGYGQKLAADVVAKGLTGEIVFLGAMFNDQKDAALRNASAFVLPSFSEGLPMAVLEAWAYGLPVAMTNECNLPIGFQCGAAARISTDPFDMAGPLRDFLSLEESQLKAMGQAGRLLVEKDFSWDAVACSFMAVYDWILGKGSRPDSIFDANDAIGTL